MLYLMSLEYYSIQFENDDKLFILSIVESEAASNAEFHNFMLVRIMQ